MANCFCCGRQGRTSSPEPQRVSSSISQQRRPSQETPTPPPWNEVVAQLKDVNDVSQVDDLIEIIQGLLQRRTAKGSVEDRAESSQSVGSRFIGSGESFFKFLSDHAEKSSRKEDIVNSAPRIIGDVLEKLGNVHWLVAGLSVVGYMLQTADEMSQNYKRCLDLLHKLVDLSDHVKKLDYRLRNQEEKLKRAIVVIVKGCIVCASQMSSHKLFRFLQASVNAETLSNFDNEIEVLRQGFILTRVEQLPVIHPPIPPIYPTQAVGLGEGQEKKVIELLQLTSSANRQPMALVIYGFGGIGKTTLAEAVVAKIDLEPYHYSRVNLDIDPSKNDLKSKQEQILNDLFPNYTRGAETKFRDCWHGRTVLTKAIQKEGNKPIFLFIDNALRKQDLAELLPTDMKGLPKDSRILVTTRHLGATDMFTEDEVGLERQDYAVDTLSDNDAKNFLLKGLADRQLVGIQEKDVERILNICEGVPLVLRIVRGHLRKQGYRADNCSQILEKLQRGKKIDEEDLSKTLIDFVYDQLAKSSQQAFLDICSFFYDMDPSHVESILGAEELTSLEEAAFVQRSDDKKTLTVHDIIRQRGRNKAKSTRIMNVESLSDAAKEQRLKDIRGVWLVDKDEPECVIEEQHLKEMTKLRILALGKRMRVSHLCEVTFKKLRYLKVGGDIPSLPLNLEILPKLAFYAGPLFKEGFSMYKLPQGLRVLIAARQSEFKESTYSEESTSIKAVKNSSLRELDL